MKTFAIMLLAVMCGLGTPGWAGNTSGNSGTVTTNTSPLEKPVIASGDVVENKTTISSDKVTTLRTAIDIKRGKCGLSGYKWSDTTLSSSQKIRLVHITEMMDAIKDMYALAPSRPMSLNGLSTATAFTPTTKDALVRKNNILEVSYALANVTCCGDKVCNGPETSLNCPSDKCAPTCGDNICEASEKCSQPSYCQNDCGACAAAPVNGGYGTNWNTCTPTVGTCGAGTQTAACDNPAPANGGAPCSLPAPTKACTVPCPVDGGYGWWFSTCTAASPGSCPSGSNIQLCNNPTPSNGGKPCPLPAPTTPCACNGGWTDWNKCTLGTQTRTCTFPTPANGGLDCLKTNGTRGTSETRTCDPSDYYLCNNAVLDPHARICSGMPPSVRTDTKLVTNSSTGCASPAAECTMECNPLWPLGGGNGYFADVTNQRCVLRDRSATSALGPRYCYQGTLQRFKTSTTGSAICNGYDGDYAPTEAWSTLDISNGLNFCTSYYNKTGLSGCSVQNCVQTKITQLTPGGCTSCPCP